MENKELKKSFIDERTGIKYNLVGGYYLPNISIPKPRRTGNIGKYGLLKLEYIKKHKREFYTDLLLDNELSSYLLDIDDECKEKAEYSINEMTRKENITEDMELIQKEQIQM